MTARKSVGERFCAHCSGSIPASRNATAKYCTRKCQRTHEEQRRAAGNPGRRKRNATEIARRTRGTYGTATPARKGRGRFAAARAVGYRSGFEVQIAQQLTDAGISFQYEPSFIRYQHHQSRRYTPDWLLPSGVYVESKGRFTAADRTKHLLIRQQHPELDIRFLFQNAHNKLSKNSKMTYGDWAEKNQFKFCHKIIPAEWLEETASK